MADSTALNGEVQRLGLLEVMNSLAILRFDVGLSGESEGRIITLYLTRLLASYLGHLFADRVSHDNYLRCGASAAGMATFDMIHPVTGELTCVSLPYPIVHRLRELRTLLLGDFTRTAVHEELALEVARMAIGRARRPVAFIASSGGTTPEPASSRGESYLSLASTEEDAGIQFTAAVGTDEDGRELEPEPSKGYRL
jgi:hypothetical protein